MKGKHTIRKERRERNCRRRRKKSSSRTKSGSKQKRGEKPLRAKERFAKGDTFLGWGKSIPVKRGGNSYEKA